MDVGAVATTDMETTMCRRCMQRLLRAWQVEDEPRVSRMEQLRVTESGVDVVVVYRDDGHGYDHVTPMYEAAVRFAKSKTSRASQRSSGLG